MTQLERDLGCWAAVAIVLFVVGERSAASFVLGSSVTIWVRLAAHVGSGTTFTGGLLTTRLLGDRETKPA